MFRDQAEKSEEKKSHCRTVSIDQGGRFRLGLMQSSIFLPSFFEIKEEGIPFQSIELAMFTVISSNRCDDEYDVNNLD